VALSLGAAASVLPFFVADRYRAAMLPPLIVAAGAGAAGLARAALRREDRADWRLGAALLPALALGILAQLPLVHPDLSRDHWLLAQAYRSRGDLPRARVEYEAALGEGGENGVLLNNLARVYAAMGLEAEAETALRRSIKADPALAYPHKNLGLLLIRRGEIGEALGEMETSVRLDAEDPEALGALAELHARRGEKEAAGAAYTKARRLDPSDPRLARLVTIYPYLGGGATSVPARP
jgi:tetratricopeptide (TPR) repeat protein